LTATFFVGSPFPDQEGAGSAFAMKQPEVPAITPSPEQRGPERPAGAVEGERKRALVKVPEDKTLRLTVPEMRRVQDSRIPYAGGFDEDAFRNNAGVHLRGTGFPWHRTANVYIAGHRLGYVGTPSWLAFWDLNEVGVGDKVYVTDAMGRRYVYKVFKEFVVDPTDVFVTRPVKGRNILTLQTCTLPDYSRRLIIQAEKVEQS
jgi:sortase A